MEQELERFGAEMAEKLVPAGRPITGRRAAGEIRAALEAVTRLRGEVSRRTEPPHAAAEWLLDNWYVAQREGMEGANALKRARRLREVRIDGQREPYVLALCRALVGRGEVLDAVSIAAFLVGVRTARPMTENELAHFFPALRGALILRLAQVCRGFGQEGEAGLALRSGCGEQAG